MDLGKRQQIYCWWKNKVMHPLWRSLKKLEKVLPHDPVITFLGIYPRNSISYYGDTLSEGIEGKWFKIVIM